MNKKGVKENNFTFFLFLIIPTIFIIYGYLSLPEILTDETVEKLAIPLFIGLLFLIVGFIVNTNQNSRFIKATGWMFFSFFWSMQPKHLYYIENGDIVNAFICVVGVYFLTYIAYQEWISYNSKVDNKTLNWVAGAAAIAGIFYYGIELTSIELWLREVVAGHSAMLLNIFTGGVTNEGVYITYKFAHIIIIFACTAVQSMAIFVGIILPLNIEFKRKIQGLLVTVVPIYFLNLVRNASVIYLTGEEITDFETAHNIIGKSGSLIALVVLLFIVIKIVPEVFDEINNLIDIFKKNHPFKKLFGSKK